ncbi:polysaccharide deacetylase family protein [uncultured Maricaulis sp.]|uniref:polysaccharide deacetylase family protein n=1 Tax=uncultured Maricaulis sp. TaxID=174710 RepID=UPI0025DB5064|nr:polysaccharide deacetylase family protein [uncultured Maricaulis sp.]
MNAPYTPASGLFAGLNRRWARVAARKPLQLPSDRAIITITFDDFPKSAASTGAAILERHGWQGTYYASAGYAGGQTHHGAMFDCGDLQRLVGAGHEIACHTYSHLDASQVGTGAFLADIARNERALKAMGLETELESFAFPYGEASPATKRALSERFSNLRGVQADINRGAADRNLLKSVPIDGGDAGIDRAVEAAVSLSRHTGWLIFYAHDVQETPTEWGCTPAQLERVCQAIADSGADVLTMREAVRQMEASA